MRMCSLGLVAVLLLSAAPAAHAQTKKEIRAAKLAMETGVDHYRADRYEDAVRQFRKALVVLNEPGLLWNIARSYEELGDARNAIHYFKELIRQHPEDQSVGQAEERIATLSEQVPGSLTLKCPGAAGAAVEVDGNPARGCGFAIRGLQPGAHMVRVSAVGKGTWDTEIVIEPGEKKKITVNWDEAQAASPPPQPQPQAPEPPKPAAPPAPEAEAEAPATPPAPVAEGMGSPSTLAWGALGAGVALLTAGAVVGVLSDQEVQDLEGRTNDVIRLSQIDAAKESANSKAALANVLLGAGAAVTLTGAVLALTSTENVAEDGATSWRLVPSPGGGFARWTLAW